MTRTRPNRRIAALLLAAALAACDQPTTNPAATPDVRPAGGLAPLHSAGATAIPGRYVVVLHGEPAGASAASQVAQQVVASHGGKVHHTYGAALNGFAASLSPAAVAALQRNPQVKYVAEDGMAYPTQVTQPGATWGLDRVDQRDRPLNGNYVYSRTGAGVRVYVIDSGIRTSHAEFGGRASVGTDLVGDGQNGQDCNGHGTHVAGTVAGATYGVAKAAQVVSVRVFGCTGGTSVSTVISAVDWVTANAVKPAVTNMSLTGGVYAALNQAVQASIASGVVYAVAAGNDWSDACSYSPASTPEALTVGATTSGDVRSDFSNWGTCVDVFAPGSGITSAWWTGNADTNILNGTSMASPHVAGVAALYLEGAPTATPATVAAQLIATSSAGRLTDLLTGSPNRLLFSRLTAEAVAPVIGLSLDSLDFTFIRPIAGSAAAAATPQAFVSGGSDPKAAPDGSAPQTVTPATTLSRSVTLSNTGQAPLNWTSVSSQAWLTLDPDGGRLTNGYTAVVNATANAASLAAGTHTGTLTLTDPAAGNSPARIAVTATVLTPTLLPLGGAHTGLSGVSGSQRHYVVQVPAGATSLTVGITGGSGDADLFVRYGGVPSWSAYDCYSGSGSTTDSCQLANPLPGAYYVMVYGFSSYSGVTLSAGTVGVPAPPGGLAATAISRTSVQLTWRDSASNETGYALGRRTFNAATGTWGSWSEGSAPANATSYTSTGLAAGGTYQYRVRSCNVAGCSAWMTTSSITLPTAVPNAPFNLAATALSGTSVRVDWQDGSGDETSFTLTRSVRNADGSWPGFSVVATPAANAASATNTGLEAGRTYRWQLRACNGAGCSVWATSNVLTLPQLPAAPGAPSGSAVSAGVLRVTWTDASANESSFQLARAPVSSAGVVGTFAHVATLAANVFAYSNSGLSTGTYRYRVRACNSAGCSAWATGSDVVLPPAPTAPTSVAATALSASQVRVTWTDPGSVETSFQVYRSLRNTDGTWPGFTSVGTLGTNAVLFNDTGLLGGRVYRYQVRACNAVGCSVWGTSNMVATP